ncbi:hypothetical protein BJ322DRAFT_1111242 [Thelephora terrestris]|uniref:Uncharacterized protein n=1 Tax=Thelephora terrestris TaxID=56493 RepID=A0A9P6H9V0_9AGAM|nr:hypothetical protein BJ322DRAFT_1111242 [Thelephora terrestris]
MTRTPYNGTSRKLVLAFDIGTTFSGAAYAFLDPGEVPQIIPVTRYLDNPNAGSAKVPSILYYDRNGNFRGVENGTGLEDDEGLIQMRWWKLALGPTELSTAMRNQMSVNLPMGKTIVDIFSDFMRYLFDSAKALFISSDQNGRHRWDTVANNIELVLTHPNGWGGPQQKLLRAAAVRANIIPDTKEGQARVHFVTEGEASFNFCVSHTRAGENLKRGDKVLIVDAGGGTIDISSYVVTSGAPLQVEELFRPECLLQGGEFVTARAREMASGKFNITQKLKPSRFNTPEDIEAFVQKFDEGLKRIFSDDRGVHYIKFGSLRDDDPKHGIKAGKLMLTGQQVSGVFEPSIQSTVDSIRENFTEILSMNSFAFLVGGFASSPWLTDQLNRRLSDLGLTFFKPDTNTNKAVSVGAVSFYIDHFVKGRISKFTYGTPRNAPYDPSDPEHLKRQHKMYVNLLGEKRVRGAFRNMLSKGTKVLENREIRKKMHVVRQGAQPRDALVRITKYDGHMGEPQWMDVEQDRFETLCHVAADISAAPCIPKLGKSGKMCYSRKYDIVLLVGLTELKAQIRWFDSMTGTEKSDAVVVYKDESENSCNGSRVVPPPSYDDLDF